MCFMICVHFELTTPASVLADLDFRLLLARFLTNWSISYLICFPESILSFTGGDKREEGESKERCLFGCLV